MTIKDLNERREKVQRLLDNMKENRGRNQKVVGLSEKTEQYNEILTLINENATYDGQAMEILREYMYMLDDIMRQTQIPWPPLCKDS